MKWYKDSVLQQVKIRRNPVAVIVAGGGTAGELHGPQDVFVDKADNLYVVEDAAQRVQKWAPGATTGVTVAGGNGKGSALNQFATPKGVAVDKNGNVYVSDDVLARVTKWAPGALSGIIVAGGNGSGSAANQLSGPQNICLDKFGNLYIADRWNQRIQKWAPGATTGVTVAGGNGEGSAANQFAEPMDVNVDSAGNIYVVDYYNNRVQKWTPGATSGITVAGGNGTGNNANQFNFTTALHVLADGTFFVRDQNNYRIQKWTPGASYGITVAGGNGPGNALNQVGTGFGLFVNRQQGILVPELFGNAVNKFKPAAYADMKFTALAAGRYVAVISSSMDSVKVTAASQNFIVDAVPAKPEKLNGPFVVTAGQTGIAFSTTKVPGHTYTWAVPFDATIVSGQGTYRIIVNWGSSDGAVSVIESNHCGASPAKIKNVKINSALAKVSRDMQSSVKNINTGNTGIFPNAVITGTTLQFYAKTDAYYILELIDVAGKTLVKNKNAAQKGLNNYYLNMNHFSAGVYFIKLRINNEVQVFRCVKL